MKKKNLTSFLPLFACPPHMQYSVSLGDEARDNHAQQIERAEIANLVRSRMESLNLPTADYDDVSEKRNSLSYVIINPSCDLKLEEGDIVYLVRPSPFSAQKTFERHNSRRKSNISFCSAQLVAQMNAAVSAASAGAGGGAGAGCGGGGPGSRRGSGIGIARAPPLSTTKSNSLSLPDSPTVAGSLRGRSNSLRVVDDILLRRSNSLRSVTLHKYTIIPPLCVCIYSFFFIFLLFQLENPVVVIGPPKKTKALMVLRGDPHWPSSARKSHEKVTRYSVELQNVSLQVTFFSLCIAYIHYTNLCVIYRYTRPTCDWLI